MGITGAGAVLEQRKNALSEGGRGTLLQVVAVRWEGRPHVLPDLEPT